MNKLDDDYLKLCKDILDNGVYKMDRTGTGTISVFGREIRYLFEDNKFPILTTKKMSLKSITTELIWFLNGQTNIKFLVDNNCNIWNDDAYKNYVNKRKQSIESEGKRSDLAIKSLENILILSKDEFIENIKNDVEFAKFWGELGPIYGKQWRDWDGVDQINRLIETLKSNPDSRRLLVSAWNVSDLDKVVLPPCHFGFQCYTTLIPPMERYYGFNEYAKNNSLNVTGMSTDDAMIHYNYPTRKISLKFHKRSTDVGLGLGYNLSSYALLLRILGDVVNMIPNELICTMGDAHIYTNHVDAIKEQLTRESKSLPTLVIKRKLTNIDDIKTEDFELIGYDPHPTIKMPLSV